MDTLVKAILTLPTRGEALNSVNTFQLPSSSGADVGKTLACIMSYAEAE